jgi:hypothetical protein
MSTRFSSSPHDGMPFRMLVVLRAVLYSSAFVLLWAWLAASVQPFDARIKAALHAQGKSPRQGRVEPRSAKISAATHSPPPQHSILHRNQELSVAAQPFPPQLSLFHRNPKLSAATFPPPPQPKFFCRNLEFFTATMP